MGTMSAKGIHARGNTSCCNSGYRAGWPQSLPGYTGRYRNIGEVDDDEGKIKTFLQKYLIKIYGIFCVLFHYSTDPAAWDTVDRYR